MPKKEDTPLQALQKEIDALQKKVRILVFILRSYISSR